MRDSDTLTDAGQAGSPHDPLSQATIKSVNKISPLSETEPLGIMEAWFSLSFMEVGEALGTSHHSFVLMRWTNMIDNQKHSQRGALSCIQLYLDHKHWGNLMYWTLTLQEVPGIRRYQQTPIQNFHIYSTYLRPSSYASPKKRKQKHHPCNKIRVSGQFRGRVSRGTGGGPLSLASSGHRPAFWYGFKYHVESGPPITRLGQTTLKYIGYSKS